MGYIATLAFQISKMFFGSMVAPLNKGEPQVPPPPDVQRAHLAAELRKIEEVEREYDARLERIRRQREGEANGGL